MNDSTISDATRGWITLADQTASLVTGQAENRILFELLAGAVFALHQDLKIALGVNLLAPNESDPSVGKRLLKAIDALMEIQAVKNEDADNLPADAETLIAGASAEEVFARQCANAAAVWLVTVFAKVDTVPSMPIAKARIWMALGMVEADVAASAAEMFVGSFFTGVKCETVCLSDWPSSVID